MLGAVYLFGKLFGVLPVCCHSMGGRQQGPFKSSKAGAALTCGQLALLLWTAAQSSQWDCLDLVTAAVCLLRATVAQGATVRCLNRLHAVCRQDAPHLQLAACVVLPLCACQTFVSLSAARAHTLLALLVPLSVESTVAIMHLALQRQLHRINTRLGTVQLQHTEGNIRSGALQGITNQKHASSWSLRFLARKLRVRWIRRHQEMSARKVCPATLRESVRSVAIGGPFPWEARAARFQSHVSELRISHAHLCDVASEVNSRYGLEVLVVTAANFCKLVLSLHSFIRDIIVRGEASTLLTAAMSINCALQLFRILSVCYSCEQVRCQADQCRELLLKLSDSAVEPDTRREAKVFILQLACKRTQFSACGFFRLNLALIRPVLGAMTTYVALLMQFQTYALSFK